MRLSSGYIPSVPKKAPRSAASSKVGALNDRYRALVLWLREHYRGARGWQAQAARRLDVHPVTLSKFLSGHTNVGLEVVEKAIAALPIAREYFFDPQDKHGGDPTWYIENALHVELQPPDPYRDAAFWSVIEHELRDAGPDETAKTIAKVESLEDEDAVEMLVRSRRAMASHFATSFPLTVEARRLAKATPLELLRRWDAWSAAVRALDPINGPKRRK